jgi:uncharacterized protein with von Willebrand factor type A (vWA) domain
MDRTQGPGLPQLTRDAPEILVGFARTLAAAGVAVGPDRTAVFLSAASRLDAARPRDVYWAGRLTMTAQPDDLPVYDAAFDAYFGGSRGGHQRAPQRRRITAADLPASEDADGAGNDEPDGDTPPVAARATAMEVLRQRDLARLTASERAQLTAMLALLRPGLPTRRSRRRGPFHSGPFDRRRTIRAMLAAGGEPGIPAYHRPRRKARRIVLLIDVSGSMAPYADALLRFAHVLVRYRPTATEVFTIGTRLSRVTRALAVRDPDAALAAAADVIPDFSGGTRLGEVLKAFNDRWGQRGTAHGAVVVVFSDGWERGSPDLLAEQVERLQRLARSVVWVNPHKGREGYLPVQSGIVAVLPHVDHFVAGHSLATLEQLLEVIRRA